MESTISMIPILSVALLQYYCSLFVVRFIVLLVRCCSLHSRFSWWWLWWSKFANVFLIFSRQSSKGLLLISRAYFRIQNYSNKRPFQTDDSMSTTVYCLGLIYISVTKQQTRKNQRKGLNESLFIHSFLVQKRYLFCTTIHHHSN